MKKRTHLVLAIAIVLLGGCVDSSPESEQVVADPNSMKSHSGDCNIRFEHSDWSNVGPGTREEEVRIAAASDERGKTGPEMRAPDRVFLVSGVKTELWVHGATQLVREVSCDKPVHERHMTEYSLIELRSDPSGKVLTCRVLSRTFDSESPRPDPLGAAGLLDFYSKDFSCDAWLDSQEEAKVRAARTVKR